MWFAAISGSVRRKMHVASLYLRRSEAESGGLVTAAGTVSYHVTPKRHARAAANEESLALTVVLNSIVPGLLQTMRLTSNTAPQELKKTPGTGVPLGRPLLISF